MLSDHAYTWQRKAGWWWKRTLSYFMVGLLSCLMWSSLNPPFLTVSWTKVVFLTKYTIFESHVQFPCLSCSLHQFIQVHFPLDFSNDVGLYRSACISLIWRPKAGEKFFCTKRMALVRTSLFSAALFIKQPTGPLSLSPFEDSGSYFYTSLTSSLQASFENHKGDVSLSRAFIQPIKIPSFMVVSVTIIFYLKQAKGIQVLSKYLPLHRSFLIFSTSLKSRMDFTHTSVSKWLH